MAQFFAWFLTLQMIIVSLFLPTPKELKPTTITYNGNTYKNCFIDDSYETVKYYPFMHGSQPNEFYELENNWIYKAEYDELNFFTPLSYYLYCPESDWQQWHDYYADSDNFSYKVEITKTDGDLIKAVPSDGFDGEIFDKAIEYSMSFFKSPKKALRQRIVAIEAKTELTVDCVDVSKISNDGMFYSRVSYFRIENKLYSYFDFYETFSSKGLLMYEVPSYINNYLIDFVK